MFVSENQRAEVRLTDYARQLTGGGGKPGQGYPLVLVETDHENWTDETLPTLHAHDAKEAHTLILEEPGSSPEGSPAKTSASPGNAPASPENAPGCSSSSPGSLSLFDPSGFSWRTFPVSIQALDEIGKQGLTGAALTSRLFLERWPESGMWSDGELSTAVTSECRSDGDGCSSSEPSLVTILEPPESVSATYSLSARAANGILIRAQRRGKALPTSLRTALEALSVGHLDRSQTAATEPPTSTESQLSLPNETL
jgi:hypothetical protein